MRMTMRMMRMMPTGPLFWCFFFTLLCFRDMLHCSPVRGAGGLSAAPGADGFAVLRKRGKLAMDHMVDLGPPSNSSPAWSPAWSPARSPNWRRPRCGVPDSPGLLALAGRQKRFVLYGKRWEKTNLSYKILRFPWQMGEDKVRRVLQEALRVWSDVTPLTFTELRAGKTDIVIDFTRYWHGDSLPFDGPGGILAHAFFPNTHRQGEIHFDFDESWTLGNEMGTDLLQVAAHELGHVLGLQHSREPGAIMSAYYSFSYPLELTPDDRQGIQYLYGARPQTPTPAPPPAPPPVYPETNEIPINTPDACQTDFDAVSMIRGELFFFRSAYVWRIRDGHLERGYPALASRHWRGLPDTVDAAFEDQTGNIWFFQGENYWVFDAERPIRGPESIRGLGLSVSHLQAALRWGQDSNYNTYLFQSGSYWKLSPSESRVDSVYPHSMQDWSGIPDGVDAAFKDIYGYAHFIKGRQYWKFDQEARNSLEGYPRYIGPDFFGCRHT